MASHNAALGPHEQIRLRMGINIGDVIDDNRDIYGNNVNIAARLEGLAQPGDIYVTRSVRDQLQGNPRLSFEDIGERRVKNIHDPIRVYRVKYLDEQQRRTLLGTILAFSRRLFGSSFVLSGRSAISIAIILVMTTFTVGALPTLRDYLQMSARASIMVLPFRNVSDNPEEDYFADAVTDDLTTELSRLADTFVIGRSTAFTLKGKIVNPKDVRREFGIAYLLEGGIKKIGQRVQINAQLVDTSSTAQVWAERFDNEVTNLLD